MAYPWPTRDLSVTYPWAGELEDLLFPGASGAGPPPSVVGGASAGVWVVGILSSLVPPVAAVRAQILDAQPTPTATLSSLVGILSLGLLDAYGLLWFLGFCGFLVRIYEDL